MAIVGPSGSGKSTLLKTIAGVRETDTGSIHWHAQNLAEEDLLPSEIGYVPQFSIAYDYLTIRESVDAAVQLRVSGLTAEQRSDCAARILREVGLEKIEDRRVKVLSGGEKRRLALALELVSSPSLLLCDEVTSGLDPKSEEEIVQLLYRLSREDHRIVLSVTHSLRHLSLYDSVAVLYQGYLAYHGPGSYLLEHFGAHDPEEVFPALARKPGEEWHAAWKKRARGYPPSLEAPSRPFESFLEKTDQSRLTVEKTTAVPSAEAEAIGLADTAKKTPAEFDIEDEAETEEDKLQSRRVPVDTPSALTQFTVLLQRRWRIFFRDRSQVWLHLALLLGFPCLVVIFALNGLPQIQNLNMGTDVNVVEQLRETNTFILQSTKVGSLVSGLVMFQVILLTLMGSNNSAREVASERLIFEKEKLGGLRPSSYLASKACFLFVLVAAQSIWMAVFVNFICRFPGNFFLQVALLLTVNAAMTAICLGISSLMKSPEQASLVSVYLVGFQLPLSGAVLALPETLGILTRPFIAAYWSWSGLLQTMRDTRFYDVVQTVTRTELSTIPLCLWALGSHVVLGLVLAYLGCKHSRWE
ncbi:MAG: ATP-binding cassette domain-containing protein [Verrucomicrobiae bacterium]|nr:ATP-binding cassette domain-containing protein [Verrucomicrobiae bacterium]